MAVEVKTNIKLLPWQIPNFARIDFGKSEVDSTAIPVADLTDEALAAMAEQWLDDLYAKACKRNPFQLPATL